MASASIIGLCHHNTYEGEATMNEAEAMKFMNHPCEPYHFSIEPENDSRPFTGYLINWSVMIDEILVEVSRQLHPAYIAYKVHCTLAKMVHSLAAFIKPGKLLSAVVFFKCVVTDLMIRQLAEDHELYFHQQLSPNDESISFGQLAFANIQQLKSKLPNIQPNHPAQSIKTTHNLSTHNPQPNVFSHTR